MTDAGKPVLQRPPGYRDPSAPAPAPVVRLLPKNAQLPPAFRHPGKPSRRLQRNRSICCRLCCCLFVLIIAVSILLIVAGGVGYLWFQPHLPSFRVENVTASVFKVSVRSGVTYLDASVTVKIQASNRNAKLGLSYSEAEAKVAVEDEDGELELGTGKVVGFSLGKKNSTSVKISAAAKGVMVDDAVGARLKARYKSKEIRFVVEMRTVVGYVASGKSTPKFPVRVKCAAVSLNHIGGGRSMPKCDLDFFNDDLLRTAGIGEIENGGTYGGRRSVLVFVENGLCFNTNKKCSRKWRHCCAINKFGLDQLELVFLDWINWWLNS